MSPFERIEEMKGILKAEIKNNGIKPDDVITQKEHYERMYSMLSILSEELKDAEYNYEIESIDQKIHTFEELAVTRRQLNDSILIFQPVATEDFAAKDMQSLADVLRHLKDSGEIKEDMILIPPDINVFRAKLVLPKKEIEE